MVRTLRTLERLDNQPKPGGPVSLQPSKQHIDLYDYLIPIDVRCVPSYLSPQEFSRLPGDRGRRRCRYESGPYTLPMYLIDCSFPMHMPMDIRRQVHSAIEWAGWSLIGARASRVEGRSFLLHCHLPSSACLMCIEAGLSRHFAYPGTNRAPITHTSL